MKNIRLLKYPLQYKHSYADKIGCVLSVGDGVATVIGAPSLFSGGVVRFQETTTLGVALELNEGSSKILIMGDDSEVIVGALVFVTGTVLSTKVPDFDDSERKINSIRVLTALGEDSTMNERDLVQIKSRDIEVKAPGVIERQSVREPLITGITAIDGLIPIGHGQRELIIGDRQTGKTAIGLDAIISQEVINSLTDNADDKVLSIYVAIGQKRSTIAQIIETLTLKNATQNTIIVAASASEPAILQYLAPYSAMSIAETYIQSGRKALVVLDDLSKHAVSYRQLSLLLRRPPGREAYPGDIFYLHSRLLERAVKLSDELGGGSITALPIIETQANDVSAYIPTNVISITDGQIFLESELFYKGIRPAINMGLSVSRVGSSAQFITMKKVAASLKLELAQFREAATFSQFGADLDESTRSLLARGYRLTEALKQKNSEPYTFWRELAILFIVTNNFVDHIPLVDLNAELLDLCDNL